MTNTLEDYREKEKQPANHIGIIPDGIRRWARKNNTNLLDAYLLGIQKLADYSELFFDLGVKIISIYGSSIHNFKRTDDEVSAFCDAETIFCNTYLPPLALKFNTKVVVVGKVEVLPKPFQDAVVKIEKNTVSNTNSQMNILLAYDPIEEIKKAIQKAENPYEFSSHLQVKTPVDFIIRTSGANLLSNFLPLQSGHARLYVIDKLFNETIEYDFIQVYNKFNKLKRVYGT